MTAFKRKKTLLNASLGLAALLFLLVGFQKGKAFSQASVVLPTSSVPRNEHLEKRIDVEPPFDRHALIRSKCGNSHSASDPSFAKITRSDKMLNYLGFLLRSQSLFYCSVPKVATRTILPFMTYLHARDELLPVLTDRSSATHLQFDPDLKLGKTSGGFHASYVSRMMWNLTDEDEDSTLVQNPVDILKALVSRLSNRSATRLDLWSMYESKTFPYLLLATLSKPARLFSSNFTRVIFVRHPFDRLASAYVDKIGTLRTRRSSYDNVRRQICRTYYPSYMNISSSRNRKRLGKEIHRRCDHIIPSFEHFIRFMLGTGLQRDVHWQPYSNLCQACLFKYNFIGKYETMQEDLDRFLTRLGLKSEDWNKKNFQKTGKTRENYQALYSKLSNRVICQLKHFYRDDFLLFDYRPEDYLVERKKIRCH